MFRHMQGVIIVKFFALESITALLSQSPPWLSTFYLSCHYLFYQVSGVLHTFSLQLPHLSLTTSTIAFCFNLCMPDILTSNAIYPSRSCYPPRNTHFCCLQPYLFFLSQHSRFTTILCYHWHHHHIVHLYLDF